MNLKVNLIVKVHAKKFKVTRKGIEQKWRSKSMVN